MRIESIIRRESGTYIKLDNDIYHFASSAADQRHTAVVENEDHIQTLLAIKEGYRIAKRIEAQAAEPGSGASTKTQTQPRPQMRPQPQLQRPTKPPVTEEQKTGSAESKSAEGQGADEPGGEAAKGTSVAGK